MRERLIKKEKMSRLEKTTKMSKTSSKVLGVSLTVFAAMTIILVVLFTGSVNKAEAEESAFSYQNIKGKISGGQTMIIPSLSEMAEMGLDVADDRNHAIINNSDTLEIEEGGTLIVPSGVVLLVNGTIINKGTIIVEDYGAILGTTKCDQGVFAFVNWWPKEQLNSTLNCDGGKLIIEEKATVYLCRKIIVKNGGYILNEGVLMAGNSIDVKNSSIQAGSNSQIYIGYYFMDVLYINSSGHVLAIDVKPLSLKRLNLPNAAEDLNNRNTVLKNNTPDHRTTYESLGEAVYYITREAKLSSEFDEQSPFVSKKGKWAALLQFSNQSLFVDYVTPDFNTEDGGSVNMEKGALIFVAHKPKTDMKYKQWPNDNLFEKEAGTEEGKVNLIINDNGIIRETQRKLVVNNVSNFLSNYEFYLFY